MKIYLFILAFLFNLTITAQESPEKWDYWLVLSNRVNVDGGEKWRYTHDFQWRANNNVKSLNVIFYETSFFYSPNRKWDLVPDLRISSFSNREEIRPGLALIRKQFWGKDSSNINNSFAHQLKYQADINKFETRHAFRYVLFYNHKINEKIFIGALGGGLYRWGKHFSGVEMIRFGGNFGFIFNEYNTFVFTQAIGIENNGINITYAFFPMMQLTIRVKKDYKYKEALIFSF